VFVHIRDAIIAGSTGRMAMLLLIYAGPLLGLPRIDVVSSLGSLAAPNKQDAVTLGGAIHFTVGILFAIIYATLWSVGIGSPTWWWGLIFGAHSWPTGHSNAAPGDAQVSPAVRNHQWITW